MEKTKEIIEYFKPPHIFRDVIYLINGIIFLLIIVSIFWSESYFIFLPIEISSFERIVILVFIGYFLGRILVLIADICINFFNFLFFKKRKIEYIKKVLTEKIENYNSDSLFIDYNPNFILDIEIEEYIGSREALRNILERDVYYGLFLKGLFSIFIFLIYLSWWFSIGVIVIFLLIEELIETIYKRKKEVAHFLSPHRKTTST